MGLRCLLGHDYANREVEREREERGNEVVVTYRTVETCERCGERRVVSENKEVRPVRNPGEEGVTTGLGDDGGVTPDLGGTATEPEDADADAGTTEPEPELETEPEHVGVDAGMAEPEPELETEPDATPETNGTDDPDENVDDAVILDDEPEAPTNGRGHGEWPGEDAETTAESDGGDAAAVDDTVDDGATVVSGDEGWPDPEGEDEGFDAEPSDGEATDVSFGGGLAPESADEAANGKAGATAAGGAVAGKQFVTAEEVEPVSEDEDDATEFFCPNCGFARVTGGSSMRAGDICPECYDGYIAER